MMGSLFYSQAKRQTCGLSWRDCLLDQSWDRKSAGPKSPAKLWIIQSAKPKHVGMGQNLCIHEVKNMVE